MWQRDTSGECPDDDEGSTTITDSSTSYDIMALEEDSSYSITVTASNAADSSAVSNTVTAMTLEAGEITIKRGNLQTCIVYHSPSTGKYFQMCSQYGPSCPSYSFVLISSAPSAAPTSVRTSSDSSSSITVQWGRVPCIHRNGDIAGYSVQYGVVGSGSTQTKMVSGGDASQTTISELRSSRMYSFQVAARNIAGIGRYSGSKIQLTSGKGMSAAF